MKCKCSDAASSMTHPGSPALFVLTSSPPSLSYLVSLSPWFFFPSAWAQRSDRTAGGATGVAYLKNEPIYFPCSHWRAHQRSPIEPLKPLLADIKEDNQNRATGRKPRGEAFDLLVLGHHSEGFASPQGELRPVCPLRSRMWETRLFLFMSVLFVCL